MDCFATLAMKPSGTRRLRQGRSPQATHKVCRWRTSPITWILWSSHRMTKAEYLCLFFEHCSLLYRGLIHKGRLRTASLPYPALRLDSFWGLSGPRKIARFCGWCPQNPGKWSCPRMRTLSHCSLLSKNKIPDKRELYFGGVSSESSHRRTRRPLLTQLDSPLVWFSRRIFTNACKN